VANSDGYHPCVKGDLQC